MRLFFKKKYSKNTKKVEYKLRKQVAKKRLRIEGKFVTKEQAFKILGMGEDDLLDNDAVQDLLTKHSDSSRCL